MKKTNYKKGLSALMAVTMGISAFGAVSSASFKYNPKSSSLSSKNHTVHDDKAPKKANQTHASQLERVKILKKEARRQRIRQNFTARANIFIANGGNFDMFNQINQAKVNYIKTNLVIPALNRFNIAADGDDINNIAQTLINLNFNEVQLQTLIQTLVNVMVQTQFNPNYIQWVFYAYSNSVIPQNADAIFEGIYNSLLILTNNNVTIRQQIQDILNVILDYVANA